LKLIFKRWIKSFNLLLKIAKNIVIVGKVT